MKDVHLEADDWFQGYYGEIIKLSELDNLKICMHTIALSMANSARYNGATQSFYSVGQHSTIMSYWAEDLYEGSNEELAKAALLHDCSEFLIGEIITPVKRQMPAAYAIESVVARKIFEAHGVDFSLWESEEMKELDWILYNTETRDLRPFCRVEDESACIPRSEVTINPQMPPTAFANFKMRYERLFPNIPEGVTPIGVYGV